MKFLVVLAVAVACAAADIPPLSRPDDSLAPIVRSSYDISPEGNSFQYNYETGNGIIAQAEGEVKNPNSEDSFLEVRGSYSYVSPEGIPIETTYFAGKDGFSAQGSHIPQVPEAILRSLAYIEANKPYVEPNKPGYVEPFKPSYKP